MSRRSGQDPDSRCEEGGNEEKREERVLCKGEGRNTRVLACAALVRNEDERGMGRMVRGRGEGGGRKVEGGQPLPAFTVCFDTRMSVRPDESCQNI